MDAKYENDLLKKLESSTGDIRKETLMDLAQFYRSIGRPGKAFDYIDEILDIYSNWNETTHDLFPNLVNNEWLNYRGVSFMFDCNGGDPDTRPSNGWQYSINDCVSFCLNLIGRYNDAETVCRENIELYPLYPSAYTTLGISLEGQGRYYEAADSYRTALIADFHQGRARERFYNFLKKHQEVQMNMPEIENITADERNEFQKMHGSDRRFSVIFSGKVKEGEIRKVLEECNEKIDNILNENNDDEVKH
jgi:tetratricopeptide (TPR) repeat protein